MKDIVLCHPRLQIKAAQLLEQCNKQGLSIKIGETLRTVAEQDALYSQGRTKPGSIVTNAPGSGYSSYHQWGTAFDFYRNDGKGAYNESEGFFEKIGTIGKTVGLEWGGDWKSIVDKPHFQLPDWGSSTSGIKKLYQTPGDFMKTWELTSGWITDAEGKWYRHADGSYPKDDWEQIDGKWYWFNGSGYAVFDTWYQDKSKWYYLGPDSVMYTGLKIVEGKIYYFDASGSMVTGEVKLSTAGDGSLV